MILFTKNSVADLTFSKAFYLQKTLYLVDFMVILFSSKSKFALTNYKKERRWFLRA